MSGMQESSLAAMRFSRLQSDGLPIAAGAASGAWVACDPINVNVAFEYDTGTETIQKDGMGRMCFYRKRQNSLKGATVKFEVCGGDPRQLEIILSGTGFLAGGGTPTGFGLQAGGCSTTARNGVFIEWWVENYRCNAIDPTNHWTRHFLPLVLADYDGGTWDEGRHSFAFTGVCNSAVVNPSSQTAGGGPFNDIDSFTEDEAFLYGFQIETGDPVGALDCDVDYTALPDQAP